MLTLYREMLINLRDIQKILPKSNALGTYTRVDEVNTKAYYILTHAEIEYFIERCLLEKINSIVTAYKANNIPHICLMSLIFAFLKEDEQIKSLRRSGFILDLLDHMNSKYHSIVNANNGIKEENLEKLFSPLGIDIQIFLGPILIAEFNSLGSKRGDFAHNALHIKNAEDPSIAYNRTLYIQRELGKLQEKISQY